MVAIPRRKTDLPKSDPVSIDTLLSWFDNPKKNGTGWKVLCPAHADKNPSLRIGLGDDGITPLIKCHAGCEITDVLDAVGKTKADLYVRTEKPSTPSKAPSRIVATYEYTKGGKPVFRKVRKEPKDFSLERFENGRWIPGLKGLEPFLYHYDEVVATDETVLLAEGEKDAETARDHGWVSTTGPHGAGKGKWLSSYSDTLASKDVCIVPHNDLEGYAFALEVYQSLNGKARSVRVVRLTTIGPKGDLTDYFNQAAGDPDSTRVLENNLERVACTDLGQALGLQAITLTELAQLVDELDPKVLKGDPPLNTEHLSHLSNDLSTLGLILADVESERIRWLSLGRLAAGKLTMVDGDPGLGKSTVLLEWSARITRGEALPGGLAGPPRGVVILSAEDGIADTIRPRAEAAGADLSRIIVLTEMADGGLPSIPDNLDVIERAIAGVDASFVIVDPAVAFLSDNVNVNRDQEVRRALAPLKRLAERTDVSIALIRHLNKGASSNALYRGGGSIGMIGGARFGLLFAQDPEDDQRRLIATTKANLSMLAPTLAYRLEPVEGTDVARVQWDGESILSANSILAVPAESDERSALGDAKDFLYDLLREDAYPVKVIKVAARDAGIQDATLRRAKDALGIKPDKEGFGKDGHWVWRLPKVSTQTPKVPKVLIESKEGDVSTLGVEMESGVIE